MSDIIAPRLLADLSLLAAVVCVLIAWRMRP